MYTVTVTLGDNTNEMCSEVTESDRVATTPPGVTTTTITGLEEFRNYTITVTATFSPGFRLNSPIEDSDTVDFSTPMASKCLN